MDIKKTGLILGVLVLTFLAGKYSSKPEVKIEKIEVVKEVIKEVKANNIETKIREVKQPDGTVIKETEIKDLSVSKKDSEKQSLKQEIKTEKNKPQWLIGGGVGYDLHYNQTYSVEVNTRLFSLPAYIGVQGIGNKEQQTGLIKLMVEF